MRKTVMVVLLLASLFGFGGCSGKTVPIGDLPCGNVQTRVQKNSNGKTVTFEYCITQKELGKTVIQGNAQFQSLGQITRTKIELYLVKDNEVVRTVKLRTRGNALDKKIYFYKEFENDVPYDFVAFGWHIQYRF